MILERVKIRASWFTIETMSQLWKLESQKRSASLRPDTGNWVDWWRRWQWGCTHERRILRIAERGKFSWDATHRLTVAKSQEWAVMQWLTSCSEHAGQRGISVLQCRNRAQQKRHVQWQAYAKSQIRSNVSPYNYVNQLHYRCDRDVGRKRGNELLPKSAQSSLSKSSTRRDRVEE